MNPWLFVHLPQLLLDEQLAQQTPQQLQQPQVLLQEDGGRGARIAQVNACAAQQGVEVGMNWVSAQALVPDLQTRQWHAPAEQRVLSWLAQNIYQDCGQIALYPSRGLLLEVKSLLRLYGGLTPFREQLERRLQQAIPQLHYYLASGYSPLVAQLLAESGTTLVTTERELVAQQLAQLPLTASRLPPQQMIRLQDVGMHVLGDVLQLSSAALGARFGKAMTHYLAELRSEVQQPQHYYRPPAHFYQRLDLFSEVHSWQQLLFPLKRLLQQLETYLQVRQLSTQSVQLKAYHRGQTATRIEVKFAHPVWQQHELLQLLQLQLERQTLPKPALELSVYVRELHSREVQAGSLLGQERSAQQPLAQLVSRLQARLGEQAVRIPTLQRDWRPERAQQLQPWQTETVTPTLRRKRLPQRPLWLLTEAQAIQVQQWQLQWGPERLVSGWWDDQPCHRDYYIAVDEKQRQGWIYKDQQGWFLHGWFS